MIKSFKKLFFFLSFQKTSEVVVGTAETLGNKWQDMRNSSIFKSFESKIGSAYNNV